MPPAAKKKKLRRTTTEETFGVSGHFADAAVRCKLTQAFSSVHGATTIARAKLANRRLGTTKWYRLNKEALVAVIVLNHFARKIQRLFKHVVATKHVLSRGDSDAGRCPISLVPMSDIPRGHRFTHCNIWFNRQVLAQHMYKTNDFINPVTRVEFHEKDVAEIDPGLIDRFRRRKELRACLAEDMAMVQSVENELEEVFQDMVEAAQEIPSRAEFRIVFDNLAGDFQECHADLIELDRDRSVLVLKSLGDIICGDPTQPVHMSKKRERILRKFKRTS
ncbi:unnamed protein product [Ectocarpus sp. 12 AP-2014]